MTAIANREKLLVSGAHTEHEQASLNDHAAVEVSDAQTSGGQPTATPLVDSTTDTKATAHDDSMTTVNIMCEKLHVPSTYRGRLISESSTFWPHTHSLSSIHKPGSPVCTPTKPNLHCDTVTDADLADEAFQSSPESMHEQPDSPFRQQLVVPFCWGAASPVERKQQQLSDAHAYKKAGDAAYRAKRFPDALDQYTKSIVTLPDNAVLLNNRASVCLKLRRWEEARADSTAALCLRPACGNASKAHCRIAKTMLVENNITEADDVVQIGLYKDPEHTELNALQALIMKIRSEIDPPDQPCCQDQPSNPISQHRPTSTSCAKPESVKFIPDQPGSPSCKHTSATVTDSCLATTDAESTLAKPVAEPNMAGSLAVQEGHGVVPVGAIAKATQLHSTSSKHATAIAQAAAARRKSASRITVKPGALATLSARAAALSPSASSPSASQHKAAAPLDSLAKAKRHAAETESGARHTETADVAAPTAADQESVSRAATRVKAQSMLPEQALATRNAAHPAADKQADSKSVKTAALSSSLPGAAAASPAFARLCLFQPPGSTKAVSGVSHSTRPESTHVTLDQSQLAAAVVQAEAALEGAAGKTANAPAAASGVTASAASRLQVQSCSRNAPETFAFRAIVNQQPLSDTAAPHALPAKPQPGKKMHAKPRVSSSAVPQAELANSTAAGQNVHIGKVHHHCSLTTLHRLTTLSQFHDETEVGIVGLRGVLALEADLSAISTISPVLDVHDQLGCLACSPM
ncbi:TPA: hypothetical protein ACH3X2_012262 [Trebouxia sp. C0005]